MKKKTPKTFLTASLVQKIPTEKGGEKQDNTQSGYNMLAYSLATFWLSCGSAPFSEMKNGNSLST